MIQNYSPCSQGLARCHVTIQRCSFAPAPKLSEEQKRNSLWSPEVEEIFIFFIIIALKIVSYFKTFHSFLVFCHVLPLERINMFINPPQIRDSFAGKLELQKMCKCECLFSDLSTNQLTAITSSMFAHLSSLHHLKLGWNRISYITEDAFNDLSALKTLWVDFYLCLCVSVCCSALNLMSWKKYKWWKVMEYIIIIIIIIIYIFIYANYRCSCRC